MRSCVIQRVQDPECPSAPESPGCEKEITEEEDHMELRTMGVKMVKIEQ